MRFVLLLLVSFSANAFEQCGVKWVFEENGKYQQFRNFQVFFQIDTGDLLLRAEGFQRRMTWSVIGRCDYTKVKVRTVDLFDETIKSEWANVACPPTTPVVAIQ